MDEDKNAPTGSLQKLKKFYGLVLIAIAFITLTILSWRKWPDVLIPLRPGFFAQVFAAERVTFAKEQGVELLAGLEWALGSGADISPVFDRPFVCQRRVHRAITAEVRNKPKMGGSRLVAR